MYKYNVVRIITYIVRQQQKRELACLHASPPPTPQYCEYRPQLPRSPYPLLPLPVEAALTPV